MLWTKYFIPTLKEVPSDAEVVSHKLMLRAGMIRKLASGFYTYLPLAKRILAKVEAIIREEMNRKGAIEVLMPTLQPRELWETSGRWETMGPEMMRVKNRQDREFVLGPTHEEVITDLVAKDVQSYRQLPVNFYQIQTKFRDEIRPRFGVIRAREFIMKDAYSFDKNAEDTKKSYEDMYDAYVRIFRRCGCPAQAVQADTGVMGGESSAEFMVPSDTGEDYMAFCQSCKYAANLEMAKAGHVESPKGPGSELKEIETPGLMSVEEVSEFLGVESSKLIKTLLYVVDDTRKITVLIRGDRNVREEKLLKHLGAQSLRMANADEIQELFGAPVGFVGPLGLKDALILADISIKGLTKGVSGANKKDYHTIGINVERDLKIKEFLDLNEVVDGDPCPECGEVLQVKKGIEVGHVFNLGTKYSKSLGAVFLDENGLEQYAIMGCYGIGVTRTIAAIIETNSDADGIIWPVSVAPFHVLVDALDMDDEQIRTEAKSLYDELSGYGLEVLFDDRAERPGVKFKDADLIGIPFAAIIGKKSLAQNVIELKVRATGERMKFDLKEAPGKILEVVRNAQKEFE